MGRAGLACVGAAALAFALAPPSHSAAVVCTYRPALLDFAFTQGLDSYPVLAANKDSLFKLYLAKASCAASGSTTAVRKVTLTVDRGESPATAVEVTYSPAYPSNDATYPPITTAGTTPAVNSTGDPLVRVPASALRRTDRAAFTAIVQATVEYQYRAKSTDPWTVASFAYTDFPTGSGTRMTRLIEKTTNALGMLVVKMARGTAAPSTHFSTGANDALNAAIQTMSSRLPIASGVSELNGTAGLRRTVNGFLDLDTLAGVLDSSNAFCGNGSNFTTVQNGLNGVEAVWNSDPVNVQANATTDYSLGVVDQANSSGISPCVDGMGQQNAWARMLYGTSPNASAAILTMETAHTMGGVPTNRDGTLHHSPNNLADFGAKQYRTFDVERLAYIPDCDSATNTNTATGCARSVLKVSGPLGDWRNDNTLLESADQQFVNCRVGGRAGGDCTAVQSGTTGTAAAAQLDVGESLVIWGSIGPGGATIGESYVSAQARRSDPAPSGSSDYWIVFSNGSKFNVPVEFHHSSHTFSALASVLGNQGVFGVIAPKPAGTTGFKLCKGTASTPCQDELYERNSTGTLAVEDPKVIEAPTAPRVAPGGTTTLSHTVTTPVIPPKPRILFLADRTASMGGVIDAVQTNAASIMSSVLESQSGAQFGAASYTDLACAGDTPYRLDQAITASTAAVQTGINTWDAPLGNGCDVPEDSIYALHQAATAANSGFGAAGGAETNIVVWFGDATSHDPSGGVTLQGAIDALKAKNIRVVAVNVGALDSAGQATAIVNATGGVLKTAPTAGEVADAILSALQNLPAKVTPTTNPPAPATAECAPQLTVSFTPTNTTVPSGDPAAFTETVAVAGNAPPGTYTCKVYFLIDDNVVQLTGGGVNPAFVQLITVDVTRHVGDHDVIAFSSPGAQKAHGVIACANGLHHVLFHSLSPVAGGTFVYDTSAKCPDGGDGNVLVQTTSGFSTSPYTQVGTIEGAPQPPTATIVLPEAEYLQYSTIPVLVAVQPLNAVVACTFDGAAAGNGTKFDLAPPAGGWSVGNHVLSCSAMGNGGSVTVTRTIATAEDKDRDGRKASDEQASCIASQTQGDPDLDPETESRDGNGNFIPNGDEQRGQECAPAGSTAYTLPIVADDLLLYVSADAYRIKIRSPYIPIKDADKANIRITSFGGHDTSSDGRLRALGATLSRDRDELTVRFDRQNMLAVAREKEIGKHAVESVPLEVAVPFPNGSNGRGGDMIFVYVPR